MGENKRSAHSQKSVVRLYSGRELIGRAMAQAPATMKGMDQEIPLPLIEKRKISEDTCIYRFGLNSGCRLGLPVGQHISARASIDGNTVQRSYTPISSDEDLGFVDLAIKIYFPNEKFPKGGAMTQHIDQLKIGERLNFVGPKGRIRYLGEGTFNLSLVSGDAELNGIKHVVMIAGGSGITPMLQIARYVFKHDKTGTKITLLFANKTENDILLREEIEQMKTDHPDCFNYIFTLDSPPANWNHQTGFITEEMIRKCLPTPADDTLTLICGPPPMVKFACLPNLEKCGFTQDRIFVY